jgi:protein-disulfide isomerase
VKLSVAVVAIVLLSFTAGWWLGRTTALDARSGERLARIEKELEALKADLEAVAASAAAATAPRGAQEPQGPDPEKVYQIEAGSSPTLGPADAAVTIVEFADFECPFCASARPTLKKLLEVYAAKVRIVFKHHPLPIHLKALLAHKAAVAAARQGKFWEMHDLLFGSQEKLERADLKERARSLSLDLDSFERALDSPEAAGVIRADQVLAGRLGLHGVPSFFINGRFVAGDQPYELFRERIEELLKRG